MTGTIGYYVHHHGDGHRQRALVIGNTLGRKMTLLGSGIAGRSGDLLHVDLPDDRLGESFAGQDGTDRPPSLHYAPIDHEGIRVRTAAITQWIATARPRLMVIDVSVEIAMLARLASVPTVYVRLNGHRTDRPHLDAFESATALLSPFPEALDDDEVPDWVKAKTFYAPGLAAKPVKSVIAIDSVLVVVGQGGGASDGERWAEAARSAPGRVWRVIGHCSAPAHSPSNLVLCGWVDDADRMIAEAGVVVGAAGDGLVSRVIAHRRPFVCLPEARPFNEQFAKAQRLKSVGAAVVSDDWPEPSRWQRLLSEAEALAACWPVTLSDAGGSARVAKWLDDLSYKPGVMGGNFA